MSNAPTKFHKYIIKGTYNKSTNQSGWRIVGVWGDEEKGEGNRFGPRFKENEFEDCVRFMYKLENSYGLPIRMEKIDSIALDEEILWILSKTQNASTRFISNRMYVAEMAAFHGSANEIMNSVYRRLVKLQKKGLIQRTYSGIWQIVKEETPISDTSSLVKDVQFQLENVQGFIGAGLYISALVKTECLLKALQELLKNNPETEPCKQ